MSLPDMTSVNVHAVDYREAKASQGNASTPIASLFRLDSRTVIISGAAGFLGVEVTVAILESGGDVIGIDVAPALRSDDAERIGRAVEKYAKRWSYYQCDVTDTKAVTDTFSRLSPGLRHPLRGLVACAGVSENGPAIDYPVSSLQRLLDINVSGMFAVAQTTARIMRDTNVSGSMVFVASMSGHISNKGVDTAAYNASKAAVQQLTRSLAAEWGSRVGMPLIRVNSLSPGYIRTAATAEALQKPGMEEQWIGDNMLYRLSNVDEFRAPVLFLLGDGSSFMTGADLRVDGGHCAW